MTAAPLARHAATLDTLDRKHRLRRLSARADIDFSSNDYLGLAASGELARSVTEAIARGVPVGSGGSRLLRGNHPEHTRLEDEARIFFQADSALFFGSGYDANVALFSALPRRGDLIVYDERIHASVHDGIAANRAERASFAHNDADAVADVIAKWRANNARGTPWIACESIYSMDGDRAPLADLAEIATRYGGMLVIDEAHATGVFGPDGRGLAAPFEGRENVVAVHTAGKALGASGALVTAPVVIRDELLNRARPFIFSTAPSPLVAAAVREALRICRDEPWRRERLLQLAGHAGRYLIRELDRPWSGSQIIPILIGNSRDALAVASQLQAQAYDVRAIRPPSVPLGTSRLRISITLNVDEAAIDGLMRTLASVLS